MYATAWEKDRKTWNLDEGGKHSSIYKSVDAGATWKNISSKDSGFPNGEGVGRIGIAVYDENIVYAVLDNQFRRELKNQNEDENLSKEYFKDISIDDFKKIKSDDLNRFLRSNRFPRKYNAKSVNSDIKSGKIEPKDLYSYLVNANSELFDTPVIGAEVYKSVDGGKSWNKTHETYLEGLYYSYGYYFGKIHVDPNNSNKIYTYGVSL